MIVLAKHFKPSRAQLALLNRGLTFIPVVDLYRNQKRQLELDMQNYHRRIKLIAYFRNSGDHKPLPFLPKSLWTPPLDKLPQEVHALVEKDNSDFKRRLRICRERPNLTRGEVMALRQLIHNKNIVIKRADKGSAVVILGRDQYVQEALRQLNDGTYYRKLDGPIYPQTIPLVHNIIHSLYMKKCINKKQERYLMGEVQPRERRFYILPKIHKEREKWNPPFEVPPGRPIVSDCGSDTYYTAEYIDHFLNPLSVKHASYVKDTYHFIEIIKNLQIPPNSLFFTADIDSLYTNIDTKSGLAAVKKFFQKYPNPKRPDKEILQLLEINLTRNDFVFDSKYYLQIKGTAMGKRFAPAYANIFMATWEEEALSKCAEKPLHYLRYLDDIWGVWGGSKEDFDLFINVLDSHDSSIRLKYTLNDKSIDFLDTTVYKGPSYDLDQRLDVKVFFKPTDTHSLLFKTSFHPKHTFRGLVKSQLLRFYRICTQQTDFWTAVRILFGALRKRGYSRSFLRQCLKSFRQQQDGNHRAIIPLITTFSSTSGRFHHIIKNNYENIIEGSGVIEDHKVISAYRRNKNLGDFLVRATLKTIQSGLKSRPNYFCNLRYIRNQTDKTLFFISQKFSPQTINCIYVIFCSKCGKQYVGETKNSLSTRMWQHKYNILHKKEAETPLVQHFLWHGWLAVRMAGIQSNPSWTEYERKKVERKWIFFLNTLHPFGLNKKFGRRV